MIFSTATSVNLDGTIYQASDLIVWTGSSYKLFFDGANLLGAGENIDAVPLLPQQKMLISTQTAATLYGFAFNDGDVVFVDQNAQTAGLYRGLDEATLVTGTNQNIDALHYDWATGDLMISVVTAGGVGTIAGLPYGTTDDMHAKVVRFDPATASAGFVFLDGGTVRRRDRPDRRVLHAEHGPGGRAGLRSDRVRAPDRGAGGDGDASDRAEVLKVR